MPVDGAVMEYGVANRNAITLDALSLDWELLEASLPRAAEVREDASRAGIDAIDLFNMRIDNVTLREALERIVVRISERRPGYIVTPNVDHVCRFQRDSEFSQAYHDAFLSLADGTPIIWVSRLFKTPLRQKLSGSDMVAHLSELAWDKGYRVFLLGAPEGVAARAAEVLSKRHPGIRITGVYCPPYGFERIPRENEEVLRQLRAASPDICFVALSSPRQELWMWRHYQAAGVPVMIGIGAGLDFVAGRVRRAPVVFQKAGLEWLWRLSREPRRLWRRYLVYDALFFALVWRELGMRLKAGIFHGISRV